MIGLVFAVPSSAAILPFESWLGFRIDANGEEHGFAVAGTGTGVAGVSGGVTSPISALSIGAGVAAASGTYLFSDPESVPIYGVRIDASNASGSFGDLPLGGTMGLRGTARFCLFASCPNALANLSVPLSLVGRPGTQAFSAPLAFTVIGAPWTTAVAGDGFFQTSGSAQGPLGAASTAARVNGSVSLVTPTYISTANRIFASMITRLTLHFVPEPSTLILLGSGVTGLLMIGRRRIGRAPPRA